MRGFLSALTSVLTLVSIAPVYAASDEWYQLTDTGCMSLTAVRQRFNLVARTPVVDAIQYRRVAPSRRHIASATASTRSSCTPGAASNFGPAARADPAGRAAGVPRRDRRERSRQVRGGGGGAR
jgi:hypothetical protein